MNRKEWLELAMANARLARSTRKANEQPLSKIYEEQALYCLERADDATPEETDGQTQQAEDEHIYNRIVAEGLHCTKRGG